MKVNSTGQADAVGVLPSSSVLLVARRGESVMASDVSIDLPSLHAAALMHVC
jgi:hypothetical protein